MCSASGTVSSLSPFLPTPLCIASLPLTPPFPRCCFVADHEAVYRQYDFTTENRNLGQFLQAAADAGLFINLRIGPFVCAEWSYGGLPMWLRTGMKFRTNDTAWEHEMETFVSYITKYVEPWLARNGGPIILAQSAMVHTTSPHLRSASELLTLVSLTLSSCVVNGAGVFHSSPSV